MPLSSTDMQLLRKLVNEQTGVVIEADKFQLVQARLTHVAHLNKLASVDALMHILHHRPLASLQTQVAEALLTNETQFFREPQVFIAVKQILQSDQQQNYNIWSAACSFGQEPYSLAMMLAETEQLKNKRISILASDISQKALKQAKAGIYTEFELSRGLTEKQWRQHFCPHDTDWQINSSIRNSVNFQTINLNDAWPYIPQMDMIFLRNVLIYFDVSTKLQILDRIKSQLNPEGYLIVGTGETPDALNPGFKQVQMGKNFLYRRSK